MTEQQELHQFKGRILAAAALVTLCFLLLLGRFVWLQVIQHDYLRTRAEDNRISLKPVAPNRGLIRDRNGVILARNYSAYTLEIDPQRTPDMQQSIDEMAQFISISASDRKRFKHFLQETGGSGLTPIRTRLSDEEVARFVARRYFFPGVDIRARLYRQYPYGAFASHVLGYMGRITREDMREIEADEEIKAAYRGAEDFGKSGLERRYEFKLHGAAGFEQVEVDAGGRPVRTLERGAPQPGQDLTLSIDAGLQRVVEEAFGERRGAFVALAPSSGEVLALVSMPNFDPNLFVDGISRADWRRLNESAAKPMLNRALNGLYPPGSTFKPFMALAALTQGKRTPQQSFNDPGHFMFGDNLFRDEKEGGHGKVDMYKSIVESCDTYYYMLANDMGIDAIAAFMAQFGFGERSGVDIDGESSGVLPSPAWKKKRFKNPEQRKWYAGETISIGIGQGYNAYTPIQLALATATLANNGVMMRPRLVKSTHNTMTGEDVPTQQEIIRTIPLERKHVLFIKQAMLGVNKEGTGARVFADAPYSVAGKTGTVQVFSLRGGEYNKHELRRELHDHALYIAFAPVDKPRIALAVVVENGGFGAVAAAPIARRALDFFFSAEAASPRTVARESQQ